MRGKNIFRVTPLLVLAAITLFFLLYTLIFNTNVDNDFRYPLMKRTFLFFIEIIVADVAIKLISTKRNYLLWLLQIFACLGLFYYWLIT